MPIATDEHPVENVYTKKSRHHLIDSAEVPPTL